NEDKQAAKELADIAGIDLDTYGLDMLKDGTDLSDKLVAELIHMDAKEFTMGEAKVEIAQINTIDTEEVYKKQADFETEINKQIEAKEIDLFLLAVTCILECNSEVLALGKGSENVDEACDVQLAANRGLLEGVVSRKKQIVTQLGATF